MEQEGVVSLWLGRAESEEALQRALHLYYSEDGDLEGSAFTKAFGIDDYDEDFQEAEYQSGMSSLEEMLEGFSSDKVIISRFKAAGAQPRPGDSCVVLLYNFAYEGSRREWEADQVSLRYVASVSYR